MMEGTITMFKLVSKKQLASVFFSALSLGVVYSVHGMEKLIEAIKSKDIKLATKTNY